MRLLSKMRRCAKNQPHPRRLKPGVLNAAMLLVAALNLVAFNANAKLTLQLPESDWQFLLNTQPITATSAQLEPAERDFARQIQPLLQAQNYAAVAKAFEARPMSKDSAALLQLRGQVHLSLKQLDKAALALQQAISLMPDLALAHRSLSMLYMLQKDYSKARVHLTRSIELGVADAQLYGQLAYINLQSQHAASAVAGYQQALYLQPDNPQWQQGLLYAWINSHQLGPAQRLVEDMLEQGTHTNPAELWMLRSQIAMQRQQPQEALASLEVALSLGEQSAANQFLAAKLHVQHGSVARAVELLGVSLHSAKADSLDEVTAAVQQILPWLLAQQQLEQAASLLKSADNLKLPASFNAQIHYFRGALALQHKQLTKAKEQLSRAIELDPALGEALLALANVCQQQKLYAQASNYYVRAAAIGKVKQQAMLAHAQMNIDQGEYNAALDLLQQVYKLDPSQRDIQQNIRELQKIVRQNQYTS